MEVSYIKIDDIKDTGILIDSHDINTLKDKSKTIYVYCKCISNGLAIKTAKTLMDNGYKDVYVVIGGYNHLKRKGKI